MYADSIRNRLILLLWKKKEQAELWAFDLPSRSFVKQSDIPYLAYYYSIRAKDENTLIIMGADVVYEFDLTSNQLKLKFFSGGGDFFSLFHGFDISVRMKVFNKWKPLPGGYIGSIEPVGLDGNKLWATYRLIFLDKKKALNLVSKQGDDFFTYALWGIKGGKFVIGSNHNCFPNNSLMAMELKNDNELLNLPECYDITYDPKNP